MTCVKEEDAYILIAAEEHNESHPRVNGDVSMAGAEDETSAPPRLRPRKKIILTLEDLRKEYQAVLDRCNRIEIGDIAYGGLGGEESDEEDDEMVM